MGGLEVGNSVQVVNMNTFRLTQDVIGKNLYLLPNGNGCNIALTPFPNTGESNYEDVDDAIHNPDDDITYVHNNIGATLSDLYDVENHTTETGTINYIQVYARAKSHQNVPDPNATFKILLDSSTCTNTQKSNNFNLVTTYSKYNAVWNINPYSGIAFTWADVDAFQYGIECSSPTITGAELTSTFRPNATGDKTENTPVGEAFNWQCVDEAVADDDATYVKVNAPNDSKIDLYHIPNHTTESGAIIKITIFVRFKAINQVCQIAPMVKTHGVEYKCFGSTFEAPGAWFNYSRDQLTNPNTGVAWTWAEIDALQIGFELMSIIGGDAQCTQCYIVVTYTDDVNPDLRTTQCYAKVNFDGTVYCDLNAPEEISQDYAQNIKMLNFWSGNRSVYGLSRSKDTTVMLGYEIEDSDCSDACARLKCVEEIAKQGNPVIISGFSYSDYNDEYQIISWGWKKISDLPVHYAWILELERCQ